MIVDNQSLKVMNELLLILDEKANNDEINQNEEGMRDILQCVVSGDYGYMKEILQDYKG